MLGIMLGCICIIYEELNMPFIGNYRAVNALFTAQEDALKPYRDSVTVCRSMLLHTLTIYPSRAPACTHAFHTRSRTLSRAPLLAHTRRSSHTLYLAPPLAHTLFFRSSVSYNAASTQGLSLVIPCTRMWLPIIQLHPKACLAQTHLAHRAGYDRLWHIIPIRHLTH